jgi:hypothetical protein
MTKPFVLTTTEWKTLRSRLKEDHPPSVFLSREKMKRVLGFTVRDHHVYDRQTGTSISIYLDFFDDRQRTMFLLKYGNGRN